MAVKGGTVRRLELRAVLDTLQWEKLPPFRPLGNRYVHGFTPVTAGYRFSPDTPGVLLSDATFSVMGFMSVAASESLYFGGNVNVRVCWYDNYYALISTQSVSTNTTVAAPSTAAYVRVSLPTTALINFNFRPALLSQTQEAYEEGGVILANSPRYPKLTGRAMVFTPEPIPAGAYRTTDALTSAISATTTLTDYIAAWDALVTAAPGYITKTQLGLDQSGTYGVFQYDLNPEQQSSINLKRNLPKVVMQVNLHGNEKLCAFAALAFARDLVLNWEDSPLLEWLRWNARLVIIPTSNPWGFANNTRGNSRVVDINRNFSAGFGADPTATTPGETYGGAAAMSEAETNILAAWMTTHSDCLLHVDFHNMWNTSAPQLIWLAFNRFISDAATEMAVRNFLINADNRLRKHYGSVVTGEHGYLGNSGSVGNSVGYARSAKGLNSILFEVSDAIPFLPVHEDRVRHAADAIGDFLLMVFKAFRTYWDGKQ